MEESNPCAICGDHMPLKRRKQCGKAECQRLYRNRRQSEFYKQWESEHGQRYNVMRYGQEKLSERRREWQREWRRLNPDQARESWQKDRARRRAIERGAEAEDFSRTEIFDRDGWRCQLCRRLMVKALDYPDPMSASLDHIVPLAAGGQHVRTNVQASHLVCNLSKNSGVWGEGEQLRLA